MSRKLQMGQKLGLEYGVNFLNRLVLDNDALGHKHVDAITHLNLDLPIPYRQGNFAVDMQATGPQFMRQACLNCRFQQASPKARCTLSMASTTTSAICSISSLGFFNASFLRALRVFAVARFFHSI